MHLVIDRSLRNLPKMDIVGLADPFFVSNVRPACPHISHPCSVQRLDRQADLVRVRGRPWSIHRPILPVYLTLLHL